MGGPILTVQSRTHERLDEFEDQLRRLSERLARLEGLNEGSSLFRRAEPSGSTGDSSWEGSSASFWRIRFSDIEQGSLEILAARYGITILHRLLGPESRRGSLDLSHRSEGLPHDHG